MNVTLRRTVTLTASLLFGLMLAFPAFAQAPYPGGDAVTCDSAVVDAGGTLTCSMSGCAPGATINGEADFTTTGEADTTSRATTTVTATGTADSEGTGAVVFQVPDDASGPVDVTMSCLDPDGNMRVLNAEAVAVAQIPGDKDGKGDPAGGLGQTGGPFQIGAIVAGVLLAIGAGMLLVNGRRSDVSA